MDLASVVERIVHIRYHSALQIRHKIIFAKEKYMFSNHKNKQNNHSMPMIESLDDVLIFSGRIVAFQLSPSFSCMTGGYRLHDSEVLYAFISELGSNMNVLLKPNADMIINYFSNFDFKKANMKMRLATQEEVCIIRRAVVDDKAKLRCTYKSSVIELIDDEINKLNRRYTQDNPRHFNPSRGIKWFDNDKGFEFIRKDEGYPHDEYYTHKVRHR